MIFVLGIDAATWNVIRPNLGKLPNFDKLIQLGKAKDIVLKERPVSPSIWCGMFSGKSFNEHKHDSFVVRDKLVRREDIEVDFIWDILHREGKIAKVLNIPFVVPPYSFGVSFQPVGFGLPTNDREWQEELEKVTQKTKEIIEENPYLLISVYTLLDRVQHFHWGEDCVLEWYRKLDSKIGELVFNTGFLEQEGNELIVVSDHGFCSFGEAEIQTLPFKSEWGELKGDHHQNAILITVNIDYNIEKPQDVFHAILTSQQQTPDTDQT
ncbi:alkaline phosphatase family protein [Chloroflexota bacterium]